MGDAARVVDPEIWSIVGSYYDFRERYAGKSQPKRTPKRAVEYATRYLEWARAEKIDPLLFMRTSFETFSHGKLGSFPALAGMRSGKLLRVWRERYEGQVLQQEQFRRMKRVVRTPLERIVKKLRARPTKIQEATRADHAKLGQSLLCMLDDTAGGYDPRSKICPECPGKYRCLLGTNKKHGFDVGALRVGVFDRLPKEVVLAAQG